MRTTFVTPQWRRESLHPTHAVEPHSPHRPCASAWVCADTDWQPACGLIPVTKVYAHPAAMVLVPYHPGVCVCVDTQGLGAWLQTHPRDESLCAPAPSPSDGPDAIPARYVCSRTRTWSSWTTPPPFACGAGVGGAPREPHPAIATYKNWYSGACPDPPEESLLSVAESSRRALRFSGCKK